MKKFPRVAAAVLAAILLLSTPVDRAPWTVHRNDAFFTVHGARCTVHDDVGAQALALPVAKIGNQHTPLVDAEGAQLLVGLYEFGSHNTTPGAHGENWQLPFLTWLLRSANVADQTYLIQRVPVELAHCIVTFIDDDDVN